MDQEDRCFGDLFQLIKAIDNCIENRLSLPALILIYAGIDICGWLANPNPDSISKDSFTNWVDQYLLPLNKLSCTSLDLYAARCGLLHTYTPDSKLSNDRKAKRLAYAWGNADDATLQTAINSFSRSDLIAVHLADLSEAFHLGLAAYLDDLDKNPELAATFQSKVSRTFASLSKEDLQGYLERISKDTDNKVERVAFDPPGIS
jgi:hypothetical protein